jgi:predicted transcriptional regulator
MKGYKTMKTETKKEKAITIKLPSDLIKKIDEQARIGDRTRAAQVRRLLIGHPDLQEGGNG